MKLESWEREPLWLKIITPYLRKKRFPVLAGTPEVGKWYRLNAEGCVAADGEETYADFQLGAENKLLIYFMGGGVSWNEYTAARPTSVYSRNMLEGFYMLHVDLFSDLNLAKGIFEDSERNPFRNWSKLALVYNTGDFHAGDGDFTYTALDGTRRQLHHHGFRNYRRIMEKVTERVAAPEKIMVCGSSAGGFGAALLCDDIMDQYPGCDDVTCLVDSGFFIMDDWHDIAEKVWHSPKAVSDRLLSDNITLDALKALHHDKGDRVSILFACSERDSALSRMENYVDTGTFSFSREGGDRFNMHLQMMCRELRKAIPTAGFYIFNIPDKSQKQNELTVHCIIGEKAVYEHRTDGVTCMEWIERAINENIHSYGAY